MIEQDIALAAVSMAEAQAYARVETGEEEALLAGLVRSASALCESFTGQVLILRPFEVTLPATGEWQRLGLTPVRSIDLVETVAADGSATTIPASEHDVDIDSRGDGCRAKLPPPSSSERPNMDETARFALPQLAPGQAQKEWFHNEALQRIDMLLCPVIEGPALAAPPASPVAGACYLVATGASGTWAGHDGEMAGYSDGGWRFVALVEGARVLDRSSGQIVVRRNGAWESGIVRAQELRINGLTLVRERQAAIPDPSAGATVDTQCRAAVASILAMLRTHGLIA